MTARKPKAWRCGLCHLSDAPRHNWRQQICYDCQESLAARGLAWCTRGFHRVTRADMCGSASATWCKSCEAERNRKYSASRARPARHREYNGNWRRTYYARNRERILAQIKAKRDADRAGYNAQQRAYRAANREREIERSRQARQRRKLQILRGWRQAA